MARAIKRLFKSYLNDLEGLEQDGLIDSERFEELRKRILDAGNDQIRDVEEFLESYRNISYQEGSSEYSDLNSLASHITNTVAQSLIEWDNLRKRN